MSDNNPAYGFGKFVPGFDFLQNVAKGATQALPQMPSLSNWVAPTLNVDELEKRIGELRAVHFWLDQNSKALAATIQALEVQKMTLATLKGMNVSMSEMAEALKLKPADHSSAGTHKADDAKAAPVKDAAQGAAGKRKAEASAKTGNGVVDPLQWWGALTQQFQQIATDAMKDATRHAAVDTTAATAAKDTQSATAEPGARPARKKGATRAPARKAAARKTTNR